MKISQPLLAVLLVGQILLAGMLYFQSKSNATVRPDSALLDFEREAVDQLKIEDSEHSVVLQRSGDNWQIEDSGVPVRNTQVNTLLDSLADARAGWAVATRDDSHLQLEVADDKFNRKVVLHANDKAIAQLYVGTSPGLRRSHARLAGSNEVYSVALNDYDMPADRAQWLQKNLLAIDSIEQFKIAATTVTADGESWKVTEGAEEPVAGEQSVIDNFVAQFENLQIVDIADNVPEDAERHVIEVIHKGSAVAYELFSDGDNHFVSRSDKDNTFTLSQSSYDALADVDVATFIVAGDSHEEAANAAESGSTGKDTTTE